MGPVITWFLNAPWEIESQMDNLDTLPFTPVLIMHLQLATGQISLLSTSILLEGSNCLAHSFAKNVT